MKKQIIHMHRINLTT